MRCCVHARVAFSLVGVSQQLLDQQDQQWTPRQLLHYMHVYYYMTIIIQRDNKFGSRK
jgi:hypothetical protein